MVPKELGSGAVTKLSILGGNRNSFALLYFKYSQYINRVGLHAGKVLGEDVDYVKSEFSTC